MIDMESVSTCYTDDRKDDREKYKVRLSFIVKEAFEVLGLTGDWSNESVIGGLGSVTYLRNRQEGKVLDD